MNFGCFSAGRPIYRTYHQWHRRAHPEAPGNVLPAPGRTWQGSPGTTWSGSPPIREKIPGFSRDNLDRLPPSPGEPSQLLPRLPGEVLPAPGRAFLASPGTTWKGSPPIRENISGCSRNYLERFSRRPGELGKFLSKPAGKALASSFESSTPGT